MTVQLHETGPTLRLTEADGPRRRILIISPGWGSSGFYGADVLEASAAAAFPPGTQLFVDHPSESEEIDRSRVGRSIRDLAAVLETAGEWDANGPEGAGVYGIARIMPSYESMIGDLAPHIGVSIRGAGQAHYGEAEGREGLIVDSLARVESIDFVARAGRGGKVLELVESARAHDPSPEDQLAEAHARLREARNVGQWFESHMHLSFTERADHMAADGRMTRDERIALSGAVGAALGAFRRDLEENAPHLYERDPYTDPPDPTPVPVPTTESPEDTVTIEELQAQVDDLSGRMTTVEAERDTAITERDEARNDAARLAEARLERDATDHVRTTIAASDHGLRPAAIQRVIESATRGELPTVDGKLDTATLDEVITVAVEAEVKYLAEATGTTIVGLGENATPPPAADAELIEANDEAARSIFA